MAASTFTGSLAYWFQGQALDGGGGVATGGEVYWFQGQPFLRNLNTAAPPAAPDYLAPVYPDYIPDARMGVFARLLVPPALEPPVPVDQFYWRGVYPAQLLPAPRGQWPDVTRPLFWEDEAFRSWRPSYPDRLYFRVEELHPAVPGYYASGILFSGLRESQTPLELLGVDPPGNLRESQTPIELLWQYPSGPRRLRVSQVAIEIIYAFGCYPPPPPPPTACPAPEPEPAPTDAACVTPNEVS